MKTFNVTIRATVTKTYPIAAVSREEAEATAHDAFSVLNEDDMDERYGQETLDISEVAS
jgi:hypothetical protein